MPKTGAITFEDTSDSAAEYIGSKKKVASLLSKARIKAKQNYESLLVAWESLHILIRMVRAHIRRKFPSPLATVLAAIAAMIYFVEPFDLIPDSVPVFGLLDDIAVIMFVARSNRSEISRFRRWECSKEAVKMRCA